MEGHSEATTFRSSICSGWSADGDAREVEQGLRFQGSEVDGGSTSVHSAIATDGPARRSRTVVS
ncbi:MAG: hypothetical protein ABIO70_00265 [Pseudomonadota bacterium]